MGICVNKGVQNLNDLLRRPLQYQIDKSNHSMKCVSVWKIEKHKCMPLQWPYLFPSTQAYIAIVAVKNTNPQQLKHSSDRISIQFAQMIFGVQFLCLHLKISKSLMLNNQRYQLTAYSFFGDSVEDQLETRAQLSFYLDRIMKYLQFGAGSLCLSMINSAQMISPKSEIKQFIDFQSQQYQQAFSHILLKDLIFTTPISIKQTMKNIKSVILFDKFYAGFNKLPHIQIKQKKAQQQRDRKNQQQQGNPFACEITQIDIKAEKKPKIQAGNIGSSNILFEELGIEDQGQPEKIQQFLKGLYLSTQKCSKNYNCLMQKNIKLIINCSASTCKNWFINDISYKWIDMPDPLLRTQYDIQCLIYQVADLAGKCLSEPAGVLFHCSGYKPDVQSSQCRSAVMLIGFIMSTLNIGYADAVKIVNKKWKVQLPRFMENQLKQLQKRRKQKPKTYRVYSICSYSKNFPRHLVAKYVGQVEGLNNIQGIDDFTKSVFVCVSPGNTKIMVGRQCQFKEEYQAYAKEQIRLLAKYQGAHAQFTTQPIDKTFRKQQKIQIHQQIQHLNPKLLNRSAGFARNEEIMLKYPILRPIWEKKSDDAFYFTIREKPQGAEVVMSKGMNWIGYEEDKEQFFQKIINCYLGHLSHEQIYIVQSESEKSLFDDSLQL